MDRHTTDRNRLLGAIDMSWFSGNVTRVVVV